MVRSNSRPPARQPDPQPTEPPVRGEDSGNDERTLETMLKYPPRAIVFNFKYIFSGNNNNKINFFSFVT